MQFQAVATDLDGTLLRTDKSVSPRTKAAVEAVGEAGLAFVIATGRPPRWIPPVIDQIGDRGLVVCANGASVYDASRHELVERIDLEADVVGSIIDDIEDAGYDALFGVEQGFEFSVDESIETRTDDLLAMTSWQLPGIRIAPIRSFLTEPVTKLIVRLPVDAPAGTADTIQRLVGTRALVTHSTSEWFLELSHPDVHKASTVERLLLEQGVAPEAVLAFGDMPNDLELIRWAGHGVAVANAHELLRAAADEVTATNDDDGVAAVIERVLGGP